MASFRVNAIVAVLVLAVFFYRVQDVGLKEALAEALGVSELFANYMTRYVPLQPDLFRMQPAEFWLDPSLVQAISLTNATRRSAALLSLVQVHGNGVFSLPLLRDEAARKLAREFDHFVADGHVSARPNSMNEHGIVLGDDGLDGLDAFLDLLTTAVLSPLAAALYEPLAATAASDAVLDAAPSGAAGRVAHAVGAASCCDAHHSFVVRYNASAQRGLDMHHDASDVTLNVCLEREGTTSDGDSGSGGGSDGDGDGTSLQFCGFVGDAAHRQSTVRLRHTVGRAVIHLGAHRHGASELATGTRQNLIVWGRRVRGRSEASDAGGTPAAGARFGPAASEEGEECFARLHPHEHPADLECLSFTHDADFEEMHAARGLPLPAAARAHRAKVQAQEELLDLASRATDAHIAALPESHQPIVRMLRQAAAAQQQQQEPQGNTR